MPDPVPADTKSETEASTLMTAPDTATPTPEAQKDAPKDTPPAEAVADVKYEFDAPEGYDKDGFIKFAKDNKIDPKVAQALLDREIETSLSAMEALKKEYASRDYREQGSTWIEALKKDKEFGGDKFAGNAARVASFVRAHFDQDVIKVLNDSGLGNHPALVKAMLKLSDSFGSDKLSNPNANPVSQGASSSYRDMFPSLNNQNQ